jgi:RNA polymerase sigma factor (sigma-70 family)
VEASALQAPAGLGRFSVSSPLLRLRSDEQLVALFRAGNEAAFGVIHDRYRQRLFAYTRQMLAGSRQDAEDALQDVFLRAYGALRADDRPVSLRAWLYRVAHNRCIDQLRRVTPAPADVLDVSRTPLHDPLAEAERREDLRRLVDDVRRLPEQQRSALLMRELDGLSYSELAGALGVTVPAIKSLLVRARIGLAEAVEARDAACGEVRADLAAAHGRGVRSSGLARRHMRDCAGCREYRHQLRVARRGFAAMSPAAPGPLSALLQLIGIGGGGSGAAVAGTSAVGAAGAAGTAGTIMASAGTASKVAAIVCGAALTAGGAVEVHHQVVDRPAPSPAPKAAAASHAPKSSARAAQAAPVAVAAQAPAAAAAPKPAAPGGDATKKERKAASKRDEEPISPHATADEQATALPGAAPLIPDPSGADGGLVAPEEAGAPAPATVPEAPTGGAVPNDPAAAAAPAAQAPSAPAEARSVPSDQDEAGATSEGSGGLSAPSAP